MRQSDLEQIQSVLRKTPFLRSVSDEDLLLLARRARPVRFESGQVIFVKNTQGTHAFWILKGRIKITATSRDGGELLLKMIEVGEEFGEISAIEGGRRSSSAIAECPTDAISIERRYLVEVIERNPRAAMDVIRVLCGYIRQAVTNIETLGLHHAETRIWCRIIDLSHRYPEIDLETRALRIRHGLSQQELADSVGLTRVMVNRQLRRWREKGLIEYTRGVIVIPDPAIFEAHVWRVSG